MSIASIVSTFAYIFICFQVQFTACVPDRPGLGAVCLHDTHLKFDFRWLCLTHGSLMSFRQRQRFIWVPWTSTLKTLSFIFLLFMSGRFAAWLPGLWGTPSRPLFPVFDGLPPSRSRVSVAWRTSTFCPPPWAVLWPWIVLISTLTNRCISFICGLDCSDHGRSNKSDTGTTFDLFWPALLSKLWKTTPTLGLLKIEKSGPDPWWPWLGRKANGRNRSVKFWPDLNLTLDVTLTVLFQKARQPWRFSL